MLYLVTTDHFSRSSPRTPEETELLHEQVTTSIEILSKLASKGKILVGGVISAQRKHIFIIDSSAPRVCVTPIKFSWTIRCKNFCMTFI